jgi:hypothetical protein
MMRTGVAQVPLHGGQCPPWLFKKMKQLAAVMIETITYEYGPTEVLRRLSDPMWFQTFGCVLGFDWHSSGLTTVVCGALKEGLKDMQGEMGLFLAGGKGKTSRKTPDEIIEAGDRYGLSNDLTGLVRTSRMVAKVDSAAVQDGYQLYHHFFVFDRDGNWAVVQQGMNEQERYARRYHWLSEGLKSFVDDPHKGVCGVPKPDVLNLVSHENEATRTASVELCHESPEHMINILSSLAEREQEQKRNSPRQLTLWGGLEGEDRPQTETLKNLISPNDYPKIIMPSFHPIPSPKRLDKILYSIYQKPPESYEGLLETPGVGPGTLRALAMVAEVTHGTKASFNDPVRYSFAHGGKDKYPFPVQKRDMEHSLNVLRTAIEKAKFGERDKLDALRRLAEHEQRLD